MPIPAEPNPLSLDDIQNEFGGPNTPISFGDYYRNGPYVPTTTSTGAVATSGSIDIKSFRGLIRRIIVTISDTRVNQNTSALFTNPPGYPTGSYWGQSVEKELIVTSTGRINATDRNTAALTISSGGSGSFFLTNQGIISGGAGNPFVSSERNGGNSINMFYSTNINNTSGTIRAGGGAGRNGRNGGKGGGGGDGNLLTSGYAWVIISETFNGNNRVTLEEWSTGQKFIRLEETGTVRIDESGGLGKLPVYNNAGTRRWRAGAFQSSNKNNIKIFGAKITITTTRYAVIREDYTLITNATPQPGSGCEGRTVGLSYGSFGGFGGTGRGSNNPGSLVGFSGGARTELNFCGGYGGYGGYGGRGGTGAAGGEWGLSGSSTLSANNSPNGAEDGGPGGTGINGGAGGAAGGSPAAATIAAGSAGFYINRSTGVTITWVDSTGAIVAPNGTRLGQIN